MSAATAVAVQVAVRLRPLSDRELRAAQRRCMRAYPAERQIEAGRDQLYTFDHVFDEGATQEQVYSTSVAPLLPNCLRGINATVFAYGQTGAGKTFTMGSHGDDAVAHDERGIIPRALEDLFGLISKATAEPQAPTFAVRVAFVEIYMEAIIDLLVASEDTPSTPRDAPRIREDGQGNTVVLGVREVDVTTAQEVLDLLRQGLRRRRTGATAMNKHSSRSHCILTLFVEQRRTPNATAETPDVPETDKAPEFMTARLHFCDLAGSERANRTGNAGQRFKESVHINSGLLALGNVINALTRRNTAKADAAETLSVTATATAPSAATADMAHVPYRDSKLTRMLKDALGGNARTVMLTCVSPGDASLEESLNTLRYAARARRIQNRPVVNTKSRDKQLARMRSEIDALRRQLTDKDSKDGVSVLAEGGSVTQENAVVLQQTARALVERLARRATSLVRQLEEQLLVAPAGSANRTRVQHVVEECRRSLDGARDAALHAHLAGHDAWPVLGGHGHDSGSTVARRPPRTALAGGRAARELTAAADSTASEPPPTAPPRLGGTLTLRQGHVGDRLRLPDASPQRERDTVPPTADDTAGTTNSTSTHSTTHSTDAAAAAAAAEAAALRLRVETDATLLTERAASIRALEEANGRLRQLLRQAGKGQLPFLPAHIGTRGQERSQGSNAPGHTPRPVTASAAGERAGAKTARAGLLAGAGETRPKTMASAWRRDTAASLQRDATVLLREVRSRGRQLHSRLEDADEVNVAPPSDEDEEQEGETRQSMANADTRGEERNVSGAAKEPGLDRDGGEMNLRASLAQDAASAERAVARVRDDHAKLELNIRLKEQLIQSLVQSERASREALKDYQAQVATLQEEADAAKAEADGLQRRLRRSSRPSRTAPGSADPAAVASATARLKQEYASKLAAAQRRAEILQQKQAEGERLLQLQRDNEGRVRAVEASLQRMTDERTRLAERLAQELKHKAALEHELTTLRKRTTDDSRRLVKLEARARQQAESLARKGSEVLALQDRVRQQSAPHGNTNRNTNTNTNAEQEDGSGKGVWLEAEVEIEVQRRLQAKQLQHDVTERERLKAEADAVARERNSLQMEKMRRSQAIGPDLLRISRRLEGVSQALLAEESKSTSQSTSKGGGGGHGVSDAATAKQRRAQLLAERDALVDDMRRLEENLEAEQLLEPQQEQQLIALSEHLQVVQAALDYREDVVSAAATERTKAQGERAPAAGRDAMAQRLARLDADECRSVALQFFERMVVQRMENAEAQAYCEELEEHIKMLEGELASAEAVCEDLQATAELVNASLDESTPVPPPTLAPANRATTGDPKRNKTFVAELSGPRVSSSRGGTAPTATWLRGPSRQAPPASGDDAGSDDVNMGSLSDSGAEDNDGSDSLDGTATRGSEGMGGGSRSGYADQAAEYDDHAAEYASRSAGSASHATGYNDPPNGDGYANHVDSDGESYDGSSGGTADGSSDPGGERKQRSGLADSLNYLSDSLAAAYKPQANPWG